ncbi:unnamed protein product, partial [Owenia fusiformis]
MAGSINQKLTRERIQSYDPYSTSSHTTGEASGLHIFSTAKHNQVFHFDTTEQLPWEQRKDRMNQAIAWITSEVAFMKVQDKMLTNQFTRCRKVIGQLKLRTLRKQQKWRKWSVASSDSILQDGLWEDWEIEEYDASESSGDSGDSGDSDTENFRPTAAEIKTKRSKSCDDILNNSEEIHDRIKITREKFLSTHENTIESDKEDDIFENQYVDCSNNTHQINGIISTNISASVKANTYDGDSTNIDTNAITLEKTVNKNNDVYENLNKIITSELDPIYSDDHFETDDTTSDGSDGPLSSTLDDIIIEFDDDATSVESSSIESLVNKSMQYVTVDEDGYISFDMSLDGESSDNDSVEWRINGKDNERNKNDTTGDDTECNHINSTDAPNDNNNDSDDDETPNSQ